MMTHLDSELKQLKESINELFLMVISQLAKSKEALVNLDQDLAREVRANERRVNSYELKIDRDCENIIALFNPVAIDLRFVLASLKINSNLERIGDIAEGIANYVLYLKYEPDHDLLEVSQLVTMFDTSIRILDNVMRAYSQEDTNLARNVFKQDELLDQININATHVIAEYIKNNPDKIHQSLFTISTVRKLERVGDQCKNIAEEIIFYIEAKVLKHKHGK
ncbi:MAG: phosphate signaling complex protein PhoU [Bacteroidia bacterium]|nr:phosphate signaling complex protein PhoU [Bacteroidia bacterium]